MANVIDSLIVKLGLDPADFKKGSKDIVDTSNKTVDTVVKGGKTIEESAKKTADSISKITREVLGLYAVFVGARGIKEFIGDLVGADAALGRFSRNLNTSPQTLYAWGAAAERVGGSSEQAAATFERIGKALFDLHRNGQALPKEYSQLQALTGLNIDRDHGIDKFLQDTAAALQRLNQIDPSQVHFIAQGMGIDDATANVMIKYGNGIGAYIDQLKKLSPQNDAIKAAQQLQEKWVTLQQTAVSLANTVLETLGPELSKLLTQMTDWITQNQDWLKSGIVQGVKDFADYLRSIDWKAVGQGLKDFGNDAKAVADALGGVVRATELLIGLWAGGKVLGMLGSLRSMATGGGASSGAAAAGGFGLGTLAKVFGIAGAAYELTDTAAAPDMKTIKKSDRSIWDMIFGRNPSDASGHADALQNNFGGLGNGRDASLNSFLDGDTKVDGRPVSKSNPLPVALQQQPSGGGFWQSVGNFFGGLLGGGTANAAPAPGGDGNRIPQRPSAAAGTVSLAGSNKEVADYIRQKAISLGIDPNIALRVAGHEGLRGFDPTKPDRGGDGRSSFGPFQLHYGGINPAMPHAGLGDEFTKATGLDARNPNTWKQQVDFALKWARQHGWRPWMGAAAEGIYGKTGIGPLPPMPTGAATSAALSRISNDNRSTSNTSSHNVSIGSMNINAPNATDAQAIADRATDALYRSTVAATANYGPR